ncbi:MAG TPA: hypothetical protein VM493_10695, partial [Vicinamibacterales bacterium]|nr:hypothetical protein [Vicinamibacterales bacterium]
MQQLDEERVTVPLEAMLAELLTMIADDPWLLGARRDQRPEGPALALLEPPAAGNQPAEWSATDGAWHLIVRERGGDS